MFKRVFMLLTQHWFIIYKRGTTSLQILSSPIGNVITNHELYIGFEISYIKVKKHIAIYSKSNSFPLDHLLSTKY